MYAILDDDNVGRSTYYGRKKRMLSQLGDENQPPVSTLSAANSDFTASPPTDEPPVTTNASYCKNPNQVHFSFCGHAVPPRLLGKELPGGFLLCPTCLAYRTVEKDERMAEEALLRALDANSSSSCMHWPDKVSVIRLGDVLSLTEPDNLLGDDGQWQKFLTADIKFRVLDLGDKSEASTKRNMELIKGAKHPPKHVFSFEKNQVVKNPMDGSIGVAMWNTVSKDKVIGRGNKKQCVRLAPQNDFMMIDSMLLANEDVMDISKEVRTWAFKEQPNIPF